MANEDLIISSSANETLSGGTGNDTYYYARGSGNDTIVEGSYQGHDTLVFTDINPEDVTLVRSGSDLVIVIPESAAGAGDGGMITIKTTLEGTYDRGVETIVFADGTTWSREQYRNELLAQAATTGNDNITGFAFADTLAGGLGNDTLSGGAGNDSYLYYRGDGNDTIVESISNQGIDQLLLPNILADEVTLARSGNDLIIHIAESASGAGDGGTITIKATLDGVYDRGVETIVFADGTTWSRADYRAQLLADAATSGNDNITGFSVDDTITGGAGNDTLTGGLGSDTYIYSRGDGNDTIVESSTSSSKADSLVFADINADEVTLARSGSDLIIHIAESASGAGDGGTITIKATLDDYYDRGVETIVFADGTTWSRADYRAQLLADAATSGNDTITGFSVDDTIAGGAGNDTLSGGLGDDTYEYGRGDGNDTIIESSTSSSDADQLVFTDINSDEVTLARNGDDLIIQIAESDADAGDSGSVTIKATLDGYYDRGVESIVFADGTTWSRTDYQERLLEQLETSGNDSITGFRTDDTIAGGEGDDTLSGGLGSDTYAYSRGDGNDTIVESSTSSSKADTLVFTDINPDDVTLERSGSDLILHIAASESAEAGSVTLKATLDSYLDRGVENIVFADGTTWSRADYQEQFLAQAATSGDDSIAGFNGDDTLAGGEGNDTLTGGTGNDTYVYARGDGHDTIVESPTSSSKADKLVFTDINASDVALGRNGSDLIIYISESAENAGDGGSVTVKATLDNYYDRGVETIEFADGTVWDRTEMLANVTFVGGLDTNDTIYGTSGSDTPIVAGLGNDTLIGQAGSDFYVYTPGDGNDTISELLIGNDIDTLFLPDLSLDDVRFERISPASSNVIVRILATDETITLKSQFNAAGGVEQIIFSDATLGTDVSLDMYLLGNVSTYIKGNNYNNTLTGNSASNIIVGAGGNDTLTTGTGRDFIVFQANFGKDTITDFTPGTDVLEFDADVFADFAEIEAAAMQVGSDTVITFDSANTVTLTNVALTDLTEDDFRFMA